MPAFNQNALSPRSDMPGTSSNASNPIYIAGIIVAAVIASGVAIWLGVRWLRKRAAKKREERLNGAFLSVKGLVREGSFSESSMHEKDDDVFAKLQRNPTKGGTFSRQNMDPSIVMPDKVHPRSQTREEIVAYHRQSGILPKPFSFALGGGNPRGSYFDTADNEPPSNRSSFLSLEPPPSIGSSRRFSVMSQSSSFDATSTSGTARKVRQLFDPVLPDELLLARLGESLTVVQSFDDGWCLVGREGGSAALQVPKSLFKKEEPSSGKADVELGCIPAWCFLKPVKGLRAERPVRSTSLGITVKMEAPGVSSRHELVSWANF